MAVAGTPWQLECEKVEQRCGYLLTSGIWSDCTFMVGSENNQEEVIQAHKLVLAMASPVFEAMFYGELSERKDPIIPIPDVQPEAFRALLQYIYTGSINIASFDMAWDLWYGAKKYMLPHLITECNSFICSVLSPTNACRAYEFAHLFDDKTLVDKSIKVISTKTKEVINDSSFEDVELNTVIAVCSLDHLTVDSELDLFHAVARYAAAEQRRQEGICPPVEGEPPSEEMSAMVLQSAASSSQTSLAAELHSEPSTEVVTPEPTADKENLKEEKPTIRAALQKIRFLSLSAQEFADGPARSDLLTEAESFKIFMNITSTDSTVPMPTGFTECRERRQPRKHSSEQCFAVGSLDHTINNLKCGDRLQVKEATRAAVNILKTRRDIQPALDKGILDALVPALTEEDYACKKFAALAIGSLCKDGSPSQLRELAESAALEPYCRLMNAGKETCFYVLHGLGNLLKGVQQNTKPALLLKLRNIGVSQRLTVVQQHPYYANTSDRERATQLLRTYFSGGQE